MIITRSWLEEFIDISKISTDEICKTLNAIGFEVDSLEKISIASKVVVGKVLEKEKHPDADKLNICQVDLGTEQVQIVCGAKNVEAGQFVPVATVGCNLGNNFIIKEAKLRGVESNGMICSATELGLPKLNDGILELDNSNTESNTQTAPIQETPKTIKANPQLDKALKPFFEKTDKKWDEVAQKTYKTLISKIDILLKKRLSIKNKNTLN